MSLTTVDTLKTLRDPEHLIPGELVSRHMTVTTCIVPLKQIEYRV